MAAGRTLDESTEANRHDLANLASLQEIYAGAREQSLRDYWQILQKRKWTVIACIVIVFTLGTFISLHTTPVYEAVTRILISPQSSNPLNLKDGNSSQSYDNQQEDIQTQVKVLQSDTMAELVIRRLGLDRRADFTGIAPPANNGGIAVSSVAQDNAFQEGLIRKLQGGLRVQQIPDTSLIEITYADTQPALAADIANAASAVFIEQNVKSRYDSTMQAADLLSKQLADIQIKMESSQAKLIKYQKEHNIIGTDDKQNLTTEKLDELNRELTGAQSDRIQKESLYEVATSSDPTSLGAVLQDPVLLSLRQQQSDLQVQYARLSAQFGPGYTRMIEIKKQLDEIDRASQIQIRNSVNRIQDDYQTAVKRERMLQAALAEQTNIADQLNENAIEYKILKQEADANRQLYDGLLQQLKEASLAAALNSSNARVVDRARMPLHPVKPNILMNLEFALLIGLIGGVALAFGLEALDTTVRTPDQIERISGLPTLGVIPLQLATDAATAGVARTHLLKRRARANGASGPLISYLEPQAEIAESYRALRTSILLSRPSHPPRSILVTSSVPKDGKTMTSINVAIVLAQQGKRVLLVDADMRRPTLHLAFGLKRQVGLSNILTGSASVSSAIQATVQPNLFVIASGPIPPDPSELLSSMQMEDLIRLWSTEYDHIIIDSPPVITVTDAVLLSVQTDAVLLVVRSGQTTAAYVRRTCGLLHSVKANILGVVVNAANMSSPDYQYYSSKYGYYFEKSKKGSRPDTHTPPGEESSDAVEDTQDHVRPKTS